MGIKTTHNEDNSVVYGKYSFWIITQFNEFILHCGELAIMVVIWTYTSNFVV